MNKITAKITNIAADGLGLVVFADLSTGESRSYKFQADVEEQTIKDTIKADVDALNSPITKAKDLEELIGVIIK